MNSAIHNMASGFQRWEMPNVGTQPIKTPAANTPPPPSADELAALQKQARDEGFANGRAAGLTAGQQEIRQRVAQLDALYAAAVNPLAALDEQTAQELARLATVVATRVIAHELQLAPERIVDVVRQAAAALPSATRDLRVRLHPADLALLRESGAAENHWQLQADASLGRGGCQLQSERSRLDATVETRLAAIIDAVLGDSTDAAE